MGQLCVISCANAPAPGPVFLPVVSLSGWMNQHQEHVIHYSMVENRVLRGAN